MTITQKFRSLGWVAAVSTAALACYLISYSVSAERAALESVERQIAQARDDILALNTEFETRSRMSQIERWNRRDFVLAAPGAAQVLDGEFELASLLESPITRDGPAVMLASAANTRGPGESTGSNADRAGGHVLAAVDAEFAAADTPRFRHAAYVVPSEAVSRRRVDQIAFLDDRLRDEIAGRALTEQSAEDSRN